MVFISWVVSGLVCVGVPIQCGYGGVVSLCSLKHAVFSLYATTLLSKEHHVPIVFVSSSGPEMGRFSQFSVQRSIHLGMGPSSSSASLSRRGR